MSDMGIRLENALKKLSEWKGVIDQDKTDIQDFCFHLKTQGISNIRIIKYLYTLKHIRKYLGVPFRNATEDDIRKAVYTIENGQYSDWTKKDYKLFIKIFYKWLLGYQNKDTYPEMVSWIKCRSKHTSLPHDILTEDEIKEIAKHTTNQRDRAFILALYESGCRISEIRNLKLGDISFDEYGCIFMVKGKTGERRIRIVASAPAIAQWIDNHPHKNNKDSYMWTRIAQFDPYKPISYEIMVNIIRDAAAKAGVKKKVHPHNFRHSRATHLADKLSESVLKEFFGWKQSSNMTQVYVHLSGKNVDEAILKQHGIVIKNNGCPKLTLKKCEKCETNNDPSVDYCIKCAYPFNIQDKRKMMDELVFELLTTLAEENPKVKEKMRDIVKRKNMEGLFA